MSYDLAIYTADRNARKGQNTYIDDMEDVKVLPKTIITPGYRLRGT